jgi:hypothetical protein
MTWADNVTREEDDGRTAQCHCGSLRVIASGEPERVYVCHCRACQRRTGAVIHSGCAYPKAQVRIEGDNKIYERDADSGFKIRFHFCQNCGSTTSWHWLPEWAGSNVFWEGDRNPNICGITVGRQLFLSERSHLRIVFAENEGQRGADRRIRRRRDETSANDGRGRRLAWRVSKL